MDKQASTELPRHEVDQLQAQNELECTLLSLGIYFEKCLPVLMEELTEQDFTSASLRKVFRTLREMQEADDIVDPLTVMPHIPGEVRASLSPSQRTGTISNYRQYISMAKEATTKRLLQELGESLTSCNGDSSDKMLRELDDRLSRLVRREGFESVDLSRAIENICELRKEGAQAIKAVDFPWSKINYHSRGLCAGWLCYLAGRPSVGKTAAAIELAFSAAKAGKTVLFNSLEMDSNEIAVRMAQRFGMDTTGFYTADMLDGDWKALNEAAKHPAMKRIQLETAYSMSKLTALVRAKKPDLVIVDYVQQMEHPEARSQNEAVDKTSKALKRLARRYRIPVVALSQLSRPAKQHPNKLPCLQDLRDSGALEQDADHVIFVWRRLDLETNLYTAEGKLIGAKFRFGSPAIQRFEFDGEKQIFYSK